MTNSESTAVAPSTVKSAERVMQVLEYLADVETASFVEIVRALDLPNSSGHQLLHTIAARGFIHFDDTSRRYALGIRAWEIGQAYRQSADLPSLAQPLMDDLVRSTSETVQLSALDGTDNVYLAISETPHAMKLVSSVGHRLPAHATGLGKVLLAGLTDDEIRSRYADAAPLERFTDRTITSLDELIERAHAIRDSGYGEDREEYVIGVRCIAMPVRDSAGNTVAALSVSMPTPRYSRKVAAIVHRELAATVAALETKVRAAQPGR
jgi:IclR family KDG regulon transcriptional repressor